MNTTLIPGRLQISRAKSVCRWQNFSTAEEKFGSHCFHIPANCRIATNPVLWRRNRFPRLDAKREKCTKRTTSFYTDRNGNIDGISDRYRYQLYQYKICPFSNIAKAFLDFQMIPFEPIEVNPLTKAELNFSDKYRKVPIVTILDTASTTPATKAVQQLNGTEEILPHKYQLPESSFFEDDDAFSSSASSIRWQDFAKNKLAPLLYPNICRTLGDSFRSFDYVHSETNSFSAVQRYSIQYIGSVAMYFAASKIKEKYKIDDVEVALEDTLAQLESELSIEGSKFLRGSSSEGPHLGDLSVFGVLKGVEGLPLWNKIFHDDNDQSSFSNIRQWYANMDNVVKMRKLQARNYGFNN